MGRQYSYLGYLMKKVRTAHGRKVKPVVMPLPYSEL